MKSLSNLSYCFRNRKPLQLRSIYTQIIVLSIFTVALISLNNSFSKNGCYHKRNIGTTLTKYWNDRESYKKFWNNVQTTFKCCGLNGSDDWQSAIPLSCYQTKTTWLIWNRIVTFHHVHENGCYWVLLQCLEEMMSWFTFIGFTFISFGVFGIVGMLLISFMYLLYHQKKVKDPENSPI